MQKNSKNFFQKINLTYEDLPFLYLPLLAVTLLTLAGWFFWGQTAILWGILILSTYIILATQFHLYRSFQDDLEKHQQKMQAYFSLYSQMNFNRPMLYMTGWAATPDLTSLVLNEIKTQKPEHVVKLGSGISTIIAAYGLQENGSGTITSLDHDKNYAQKTKQQLKSHGIEELAKVVFCPLTKYKLNGSTWEWYNLEHSELPSTIDLLLVDGPLFMPDTLLYLC